MTVSSQSPSAYQTTLNNNTFEITKIYALSNKTIAIGIVNPQSTTVTGTVVMSMYLGGFLTAQGSTTVAAVGPVYLGVAATSSSRVVGGTTELTVLVNRVSPFAAEKNLVMDLSSALFDLTNAKYNGQPLVLPLTLPISTTSITVTNLTNLLSVPSVPPTTGLSLYSIDSANSKVAQSTFSPSALTPNTPTTALSYSFARTSTSIGGVGNLTISYTPRLPSSANTITITLPLKQMAMLSSGCQVMVGASYSPCQVLSSNSQSITLAYQNQSKTVLTDVVNQ